MQALKYLQLLPIKLQLYHEEEEDKSDMTDRFRGYHIS